MSEPVEYEFTKLARFIARRNNCGHCKGTGIGWTSTVGIFGTGETEEIQVSCPHCSDQLPAEEPVALEPCSKEEFLDRLDDTAMALGD